MTFVDIDRDSNGHLRIRDAIERRRCALYTDTAATPRPVDDDAFSVPVDAAAAVEVGELTFPDVVEAYVRDDDGALVHQIRHFERYDLPAGTFSVELCSPIKLYLRVEGPLTVDADGDTTVLSFAAASEVLVGARSYHERPAATITTTDAPEDVFTALSYLGSALKTTTPERSFPTLRGHPPAMTLGEELDVPDGLVRPDTGVTVEVPPTLDAGVVVAPLAYYLGAEVVAGSDPRLLAGEFVSPLEGPAGFERTVGRTLKQLLFLDCVVRTEGYYPVELQERTAVEDVLPFDLAATYDRSLAEQVRAYLSVPYESLEPHMPTWKLTSHVDPVPTNLETLPYLVDDLSTIRTPSAREVTPAEAQSAAIESFMSDGPTRSRSGTQPGSPPPTPRLVRPERTDSLEQAWVGPDVPVGASKVSVAAFRNRLRQEPTDGSLSIAVICNDESMLTEHETASDVYGSRESLPFDVTVHRNATTTELAEVLESGVEFVHYIGHIDAGGFCCPDGHLDAADLDDVGTDAFFLNACTSYQQGMALIEAGAVGGVVTVDEVVNTGATAVGRMLARLLNAGFPLQAALNIASDESLVGAQYLVVGDGNTEIAQSEAGATSVVHLEERDDRTGEAARYRLSFQFYPTRLYGMGTLGTPVLEGHTESILAGNRTPAYSVREENVRSLLDISSCPVYFRNRCWWSTELQRSQF
ncbi:hypothetical protein [Halomarina rubra]|uniref:CHAT domain-containing protein n=1 Tax=Halomarina rubra TaxID=2071873 RepID=A0ABD6B0K8_9EURY|nr:hypothetical protein [Halomarina rubra]